MKLKYKPVRKTYCMRLEMGLPEKCRHYGVDLNDQFETLMRNILKSKQKSA